MFVSSFLGFWFSLIRCRENLFISCLFFQHIIAPVSRKVEAKRTVKLSRYTLLSIVPHDGSWGFTIIYRAKRGLYTRPIQNCVVCSCVSVNTFKREQIDRLYSSFAQIILKISVISSTGSKDLVRIISQAGSKEIARRASDFVGITDVQAPFGMAAWMLGWAKLKQNDTIRAWEKIVSW